MFQRSRVKKSNSRKAQANRLKSEMLESRRLLAGLEVVAIPFIQGQPDVPHPVHEQGNITLKAIARGADSGGDYEIWWDTDFDGNFDNNPSRIVNATNGTDTIYDIGQTFTVPNVSFDQQLDVQVRIRELDSGEEAFGTFHIYVNDFRPSNDPRNWTAQQLEVIQQMSVQESMWYVHRNLTRSGDLTSGMTAEYAYDNVTPQAIKLFISNTHLPAYAPDSFDSYGQTIPQNFEATNDARWHADPYAESAMRMLNEVVSTALIVAVPSSDEGDQSGFFPNGTPVTANRLPGTTDEFGVYFSGYYFPFDTTSVGSHATALSAVALSLSALGGTPIQVGDTSGYSWEWLTQQGVDWLGFAQTDSGTGRGAWGYQANDTELFGADTLKWAVTAFSDVERVAAPYGVIVDNLHKYRVADALIAHANANGLAEHFIGSQTGDFMHTGTMIQAARWLGIQYFSPSDNQIAFPGISSATRGQLNQSLLTFSSAAASYWNALNKLSYFGFFDSFWRNSDYLQGNTNALYNVTTSGEPLIMLRYADAFREGQQEVTVFANHDWNREFTTFLSRGQERHTSTLDPWQDYDTFGSFVTLSTVTNSYTFNHGAPYWSSVVAGLAMTSATTNPPKYGSITLPTQAYAGQSLEFSLDPAPNFLAIQWDFDASNGLGWDTTGTADATGSTVNYTFSSPGIYTITARGVFADTTSYLYTRTLRVDINTPPVANNDSISTDQDSTVMFDVLVDNGSGADQDTDGNLDASLTTALTSPAKGILTQQADGNFTFDPNGEFDDLPAGQSTTVSFDYQIEDVAGATSTATVAITITGNNDAATIGGTLTGTTDEDTATAITGTATVSDVDTGEDAFTPQASTAGTYGTFTIDASGNWIYTLNPASVQDLPTGSSAQENFNIASFDGTTSQVAITITGNNDAATIGGTLTGTTDEDTATAITGTATVSDVDTGESSFTPQASTAGTYGTFAIDASGNWTYTLNPASVQDLPAGSSAQENFNIASFDGTTSQVAITITGNNDAATIGGTLTGTTDEDTATAITGTATVSDVDTGESSFTPQASTAGTYGTFAIDASGNWSFTLNPASVQDLSIGDHVDESFTVTTIDGTEEMISIRIDGVNDLAIPSIDTVTSFRFVGSEIEVTASATDVDGDDSSIDYQYAVYIDGNPTAAFSGGGVDQTQFAFTPTVAGEYRIELTAIDDDNGESTVDTTITVGTASLVSFQFADDGALPGGVNNNGPGPEALYHEWQDATGQLWITIDADVPNAPFDLTFQLTSTDNWLAEPQLVAHMANSSSWQHQQDANTLTTSGTLHGLDLSEYQAGDRVLLATIVYPDDLTEPAGLLMNKTGEYTTATNDHGVQLVYAQVSPSSQPFAVDQNVSGQFLPVVYDSNDDGKIGIADFAQFISQYSKAPNASNPEAYRFDYNWDGKVGINDFANFISHYGRKKGNPPATIVMPNPTPGQPQQSLVLEGESLASPELSLLAESSYPNGASEFTWLPPVASFDAASGSRRVESQESASDEIALTDDLAEVLPGISDHADFDLKVVDAIYQNDLLPESETLLTEDDDLNIYQLLAE
ncbi:hypothetical protein C5Y96_02080 [Blastopirellula marina]|uniref:RapA2 cadherin-like domain-containing protein n=1 Tax=Blastopirellula marina TaxID=124 RepID=A0A2S8G2P6_9BACT|nr:MULTISPECIES: VCBS domain-containing protein [Pirellulaceae]PQO38693.1 hypothetical protein C5Y96_02080 [Blastopirellula marina]RCS55001.1 hypothetical protein DTL36_02085 [Bremerella cremea]